MLVNTHVYTETTSFDPNRFLSNDLFYRQVLTRFLGIISQTKFCVKSYDDNFYVKVDSKSNTQFMPFE